MLGSHLNPRQTLPYTLPWLISGILYGLSFPSWETLNLAPLAWVALTFLLIPEVVRQKPNRYILSALLFSLTGSLIAGYWTMKYSMVVGVMAVVWHGLIVAMPLWIFRYLAAFFGYSRSLILLPFIWTGWEWVAASFQPFFWGALGSTQSNLNWIIQLADITGVWGLSFWLVALNACLAYVWSHVAAENTALTVSRVISVFAAFMIPMVLYGQWRSANLHLASPEKLSVLIVQPGSAYSEGWTAIRRIMDTANPEKFDLVTWPESIFTGMPFRHQGFADDFSRWKSTVMMVFIASQYNPERTENLDQYGAAIVLNQNMLHQLQSGPAMVIHKPHYRKQKLVPYAELQLIPDGVLSRFPALKEYTPERMQNPARRSFPLIFKKGQALHLLAPLLCYEAIFPDVSGYAVKNGAEALFVLANDLQFGTAETWQAASFARLRAVETRRPVVRTSTGGVVGVIDILGRWVVRDSQQESRGFPVSIDLVKDYQTFYVQWIDWFPKFCLAIALGLMSLFCASTRSHPPPHGFTP